MTKHNPHIGSSFDDFLVEEILLTGAEEAASARITNWQQTKATESHHGNGFWNGLQELRATIEREGIIFDDEEFADLRDRSPGREVNLQA
jgi:hypothetical protein